jgi:hypothetical protein
VDVENWYIPRYLPDALTAFGRPPDSQFASAAQLRPSAVAVTEGRSLVPTVICAATGSRVTEALSCSRAVSTPSTTVTR